MAISRRLQAPKYKNLLMDCEDKLQKAINAYPNGYQNLLDEKEKLRLFGF